MFFPESQEAITAIVLGARGGIGGAFVDALCADPQVARLYATSRSEEWVAAADGSPKVARALVDLCDESSLQRFAEQLVAEGASPRLIINCSGLLHEGALMPERTWRELSAECMARSFAVNAIGPALAIKHLVKTMPRKERALFLTLSARVGSISDNRLGGWYSYRASKAAQNMIVKTASIEAANRYPKLIVCALHPGTVASDLSAPFTKRLKRTHVVFSPEESCQHLCRLIAGLSSSDSGSLFAWDGAQIAW